jgi:hypothetical protein
MVLELKPDEFNERLLPIFEQTAHEVGKPERLVPSYFFPNWRNLMTSGIARTWELNGVILGALFYPDIYGGKKHASVMFFTSLPEVRGLGRAISVFDEFEKSAEGMQKSSAAYMALVPERLRKLYRSRGYELTEEIWSKL